MAFQALVLMRERPMRARCADRLVEVQDSAAAWVAYAGSSDPEPQARLAWIFARAATP